MEKTRKDSRGYALHTGETQRKDTHTRRINMVHSLLKYKKV